MLRNAAAVLLALLIALSPAFAGEPPDCAVAPPVLWGDGEHDDTAALNAWFRGETVVWAQTHEKVGAEITDRTFLLNSVVYIATGTVQQLERLRMVGRERQQAVSGATIRSGDDPDMPPVAEGVTTIGAD